VLAQILPSRFAADAALHLQRKKIDETHFRPSRFGTPECLFHQWTALPFFRGLALKPITFISALLSAP
jgi:hypothetical protein